MARVKGETKAEWLTREIARAVGAGRPCDVETVDFSDCDRPPTCLEVDFPIVPVNQIAKVESSSGAGRKPIYTMNKWWARRPSSVFRALLIAAATKAPSDPALAAKAVWDVFYGNHQKRDAFKAIKIADVFMGGGTTVVEGARLGMQVSGNDLSPVAWFVVRNEMAEVSLDDVEALLNDIEAEVKPQVMPFYACKCPRGHDGRWKRKSSGEVMASDFGPQLLSPDERRGYEYEGPEVVYSFWAKHGPCQVSGCGHRTPIMTSPCMATKTLTAKYWARRCSACGCAYHLEERSARIAPGVPLVVAESEHPFAIATMGEWTNAPDVASCPTCGHEEHLGVLPKPLTKKVQLSLLVHPTWLAGESGVDGKGQEYGGCVDSSADATIRWNEARARTCSLLEVRGTLPQDVECPVTGVTIPTGRFGGTVPKKSSYACGSCGTTQDVLETVRASGTNGPTALYAVQGYCPDCHSEGQLYRGRFFAPVDDSAMFDSALREWELRKEDDLADYWPRSEIPYGFMTGIANGDIRTGHGFTHWWKLFNPRQLLSMALILRATYKEYESREYGESVREYVLCALHRFLQHNNMLCFWDSKQDCLAPSLSNANYHPKSTLVENCIFTHLGRGNYRSSVQKLRLTKEWVDCPWELASTAYVGQRNSELAASLKGKSQKVRIGDRPLPERTVVKCCSATALEGAKDESLDLVVTDPPFGGLLHYSELADFFYVWLRLVLKKTHPSIFGPEYTPKSLEAVANRARQPGRDEETGRSEADLFYQRLLTASWKEAHRVLKAGGLLVFTFHHSEDAPWVSVLESLFDAGFYLEATYPIRSDETKGLGEFGSKQIEYDIVHVCRKRTDEPEAISWARMRRQVLRDVRRLQDLLEHHSDEGLPEADLKVIRRGKALEYFSRHYGKVYKDEGVPISVQEALVGINQLLDEEAGGVKEPPPHNAEPFTRMFLRLFDGSAELARDQMQKHLRGTGTAPSDFLSRGWCFEQRRVFHLTPPLEIARKWQGKHRRGMTSDYDQAAFLIGACHEASGISASETLNNQNFKPHPALGALLTWHKAHGATNAIRNAASIAAHLYRTWEAKNQSPKSQQLQLFFSGEEE